MHVGESILFFCKLPLLVISAGRNLRALFLQKSASPGSCLENIKTVAVYPAAPLVIEGIG
jgi:hypothetical protein